MTPTFDECYPPELLAEREAALRRFWAGEGPRAVTLLHDGNAPYRQIDDDDLIVENAAKTILASADLPGLYLPWFGPDFGTVSTAVYWGGEEVVGEGGKPFIKPAIHGVDDLDRITPTDPAGGQVPRAIDLANRVKARLETDRIWTRIIDLQGPLSTAALVWEQEDFLVSLYTDPEAVHRFLDQVTEQLIAMVRALHAGMGPTCGSVWPWVWQPEDLGITVTEDMMPLLSPDIYKEFGLPYLKRLSDAFGGVLVHCCGEFERHLPNMAASGVHYRGLEYFEPHTRTEAVYEHLGPSLVYVPSLSGFTDFGAQGYIEYLQTRLAKAAPADMRFMIPYESTWAGADALPGVVERALNG